MVNIRFLARKINKMMPKEGQFKLKVRLKINFFKKNKIFLENICFEYLFCREFHYLQNEFLFFENKIILIKNIHN